MEVHDLLDRFPSVGALRKDNSGINVGHEVCETSI